MNQELKAALEQDARAQEYLSALKKEIAASIVEVGPIPGVELAKKANPSIAIVRFSALKGMNMSSATYIPKSQSDAVAKRISSCATVNGLLDALRQISHAGCVRLSNGERVTLNENTMKVISGYLE